MRNCKECGVNIDSRPRLALYCEAHARGASKPKISRQKAINAMCRECIVDPQPGNGTWRQQTEACTATECPLFEFRPKSAA